MACALKTTVFAVASLSVLTLTTVLTADHVFTAGEAPSQEADGRTHVTVPRVGMQIFLIFTEWNPRRETQFHDCMTTMHERMAHESHYLHFHVIVDTTTIQTALQTVHRLWCDGDGSRVHWVNVSLYDLKDVQIVVQPYQNVLQQHFSDREAPYYNKTVFFVEAVLHKFLPETLDRVVTFDIDIKFNASVADLYKHFSLFSPSNILGLAYEQQPTYLHYTEQYRASHPETPVGGPPPLGRPGLNSGVMLVDLARLRGSDIYNRMLEPEPLKQLTEKYSFQSNLGDQDFYTLLSFEYPELFYVLPCHWNRQLCRWFETHGYEDSFDAYHRCDGDIYIYHGNCNSTLPDF